ncbi:hypothetical protein THF1C08_130003 [Vibrio jasicida]|uniref:Uncharacterized protein n=1 Tax=Vibrio jasicida TaxID=766224 RepID=A0AAU9QG98_9VIBR|nr:hypothetical protein THF1C08_130003 [Vibrio jasicida]CAH1572478.1 hypothetical protein THF1A12_120003 [Vibrio jasicida]
MLGASSGVPTKSHFVSAISLPKRGKKGGCLSMYQSSKGRTILPTVEWNGMEKCSRYSVIQIYTSKPTLNAFYTIAKLAHLDYNNKTIWSVGVQDGNSNIKKL